MQELSGILTSEAGGLLVRGNNVRVLDAFGGRLSGKACCVYMDPPYRNGDSYSHYRDEATHEEWISYMASLLPRVWDVVADEGSVWISIDDEEMAYLKVLCDVHFGRSSYVATIVWQHRTTRENRAAFSHNHEYLLVYAKNPDLFKRTRNKIAAPDLADRYKNPDDDPRGPWQSITATAQAGHAVPTQFYPVISPTTGKRNMPPKGRCWVYAEDRMNEEIAAGNIWFGSDGNGVPRIKRFLRDKMPEVVPNTLWTADEVGTTMSAKKQLLKMFPDDKDEVFETPKPEGLLARIIGISTNPGDIVLDPFLGSGTTAAVAQKMGRRYLGIDRSEKSFEVARSRLDAVIAGDQSGISADVCWKGGGFYQTATLVDDQVLLSA
ncbi:site-specific DNA-methyltransferase [Olsenella sp. An270]|nr:site-specific DNA-methyltransferase [Olsenella sp. An270]